MTSCVWHTCLMCTNPGPELYPGGICLPCQAKHDQRERERRLAPRKVDRDDNPRDWDGPSWASENPSLGCYKAPRHVTVKPDALDKDGYWKS